MKELKESLLDDIDDQLNDTTEITDDFYKKYVTGNYKLMTKKTNKLIKITGKFVIKNYPGETLPDGFKLESVKGSLIIEKCPNLINIENLFPNKWASKVVGDLSISNCPKLENLIGCPYMVEGVFSCVGNTSLKTLEGCPEIVDVAAIMKNGKKFTEK